MKKILLSTALFAMGATLASAADFEVYLSTKVPAEGAEIEYTKVEEGASFTVDGIHFGEEYDFGTFYLAQGESCAFVKLVNLSSASKSLTINKSLEYDNSVIPEAGGNPIGTFQTCIESCHDTPFDVTLAGDDSTKGGVADHLGYTITFQNRDQKNEIKLDTKYNFTVSDGSSTLAFSVLYNSDNSGVNAVEFDENMPKEYYNLQGVRVAVPEVGGMYIIKQGNKVAKQIVR